MRRGAQSSRRPQEDCDFGLLPLADACTFAGGEPQREDENIIDIEDGDLPAGIDVGSFCGEWGLA